MSLTRTLRERAGSAGTGQSGFALLATILIVMMTSMLVMAVLGLSIATTTYSGQQVRRDTATRNADAAMEAAVNVLRHEGMQLGSAAQDCPDLFPSPSGFPIVRVDSGDDVVVDCKALTPDVPYIPTDDRLNSEGVYLVGEDYGSAHGNIDPTTFPWTTALGASNGATVSAIASSQAGLVASGPDALPFTNPVTVHSGAVGVRDPVTNASGQNGPAITVGAAFNQGNAGPLATPSPSNPNWACGILSPLGTTPATQVVSRPDAPQCGSVAGQGLSADNAEDAGADNSWPLERRTQLNRTSQIVADCNSLPSAGDVATTVMRRGADLISFPPGAYDVGALNRWLSSGNCDNKVFWFMPGTYWFGCGPAQATTTSCDAANGDALRINDASSVVVFGAENGWGTPTLSRVRAKFPKACNPGAAGVAITLQSRTVIRHDAGQVAICDRSTSAQPSTAVYQPKRLTPNWPASGDNPPSASESPGAGVGGFRDVTFTDLGNLAGAGSATANANCDAPFRRLVFIRWLLGFIPIWELRWFQTCNNSGAAVRVLTWQSSVPAVTGDNPITNVKLRVVGSGVNLDRGTQFNLALTRSDGSVMCQLSSPTGTNGFSIPDNGGSFGFDLNIDLSSTCPNIRNLQDLSGVGAKVTVQMVPRCNTGWFFGTSGDPTNKNKCEVGNLPRISLDLISLSAKGTDEGAAGAAFRVTSDASNPSTPASFNVYGRVSAPLADLDIYWNGPLFKGSNGDLDPIFGGSVYFNGMGSKATSTGRTGIVCCAVGQASERRVQLHAWTDVTGGTGVLSGSAVVTIQDWRLATEGELDDAGVTDSDENRVVVAPGYRARIESWSLCAGGRANASSPAVRWSALCYSP